ncbi:23S ribosomal RNA methyltransferase Erm [Paenibacillus sp. FSL M7-1455]|uniref:23S ribosomal RNA methyltransferase Erm n=1 Tax=Paenibacillus sp. FSL M7-1455 TaxID=2975316 RepID=UPI0030F544CB
MKTMTKRKMNKYAEHRTWPSEAPNFSGQHFIHNKRLLKELVRLAQLSDDDFVLELGAGKGAITTVLSEQAGKVIAVEYDPKLANKLEQLRMRNVKVVRQDILRVPLPKLPFVVVSNIPFAITTSIMKMLFDNPKNQVQRAVIIMEKGAAKRFASSHVKDPYVAAWKMFFDIRYVKGVSRENFSPPPKVDCAIITVSRKKVPMVPIKDFSVFRGLADYMLKKPQLPVDWALRGIFTPPQIKNIKRNLGIKQEAPVAFLSESQWAGIFEAMIKHAPRFRWPKVQKAK